MSRRGWISFLGALKCGLLEGIVCCLPAISNTYWLQVTFKEHLKATFTFLISTFFLVEGHDRQPGCSWFLTELISMLYLASTGKAPLCDPMRDVTVHTDDITSFALIIPCVMLLVAFLLLPSLCWMLPRGLLRCSFVVVLFVFQSVAGHDLFCRDPGVPPITEKKSWFWKG